jgi:hypothetical protein
MLQEKDLCTTNSDQDIMVYVQGYVEYYPEEDFFKYQNDLTMYSKDNDAKVPELHDSHWETLPYLINGSPPSGASFSVGEYYASDGNLMDTVIVYFFSISN